MALNGCCPTPSSVSGVQASEEQPMAVLVVHRFDVRQIELIAVTRVPSNYRCIEAARDLYKEEANQEAHHQPFTAL